MNQQKIGELLKHLREDKGLTQAQLAENFNVSSRTVSRWETGSNMPDVDMLIDLADFYDVDIREILDGERKNENLENNLEDTLKKVAAYAVEEQRTLRNRAVYTYAGCGAIAAAVFNILFNKASVGVLIGVVPENICDIIIKLVTATAVVGAGLLAMYVLGAFDKLGQRKTEKKAPHTCKGEMLENESGRIEK